MKKIFILFLLPVVALLGCDTAKVKNRPIIINLDWQRFEVSQKPNITVYDNQLLDMPQETTLQIVAAGTEGIQLLDQQGTTLDRLQGYFEAVDSRSLKADHSQWLITAVESVSQSIILGIINIEKAAFSQQLRLPERPFTVVDSCLFRDHQNHSFVFVVGEEGFGEQWLVASGTQLLAKPQRVRTLPVPPQAENCQVDDVSQTVYVNEKAVGLWAYSAHPEAETTREAIDMVAPFGGIKNTAGNMVVVPGGILLIDPDAAQLHAYQRNHSGWSNTLVAGLANLGEAEQMYAKLIDDDIALSIRDDETGNWYTTRLGNPFQRIEPLHAITTVKPLVETEPVGRHGDAADDPAIWVHPYNASHSLILGTNKKVGLQVYNLNGKLLQALNLGRLNNVDLRSSVKLTEKTIHIAAASNRDHNSISLFTIDEQSQKLSFVGEIATPLQEIYGLCLYQPSANLLYAFANSKDGLVIQYQIDATFHGREVRRFTIDSQPEGCVADDSSQQLFVGEEDVGVWVLNAEPNTDTTLHQVATVGDVIKDDVEGLALYHDNNSGETLLIISSQGNNSYVVVEAAAPHKLRGQFRIGLNAELGIDGASETDGLEVISANLGNEWSRGILVVQDGRNRMPEETQNFKLVPWTAIEQQLKHTIQ